MAQALAGQAARLPHRTARRRRDARCLELGRDSDAGASSGFRGVSWNQADGVWQAQILVDGKKEALGNFEGTARGEVDAALAYDAAARAAGRPESANFQLQTSRRAAGTPPVQALPAPKKQPPARGAERERAGAWRGSAGRGIKGVFDPL
jgi:hypothetical protein